MQPSWCSSAPSEFEFMSRIGKQPIAIPPKVKVEVKGQKVLVEGPKGKLNWELPRRTSLKVEDGKVVVSREGDDAHAKALHGLSRALVNNMVRGVSEGFVKKLEIQGVGFKAAVVGTNVTMSLGYSHPIVWALVNIPAPGARGVLFAHGPRFGGHALYVKDNRLHYVNNFVGMMEQAIVGTQDVPTGENLILSASFDKDGEDPPHVSTGILSLYHGDKKVGEGRIKTQPGMFSLAGEGLCVGRDSGEAVTDDYPGEYPHAFTGGTIKRVAVDVSGDPYVDLEREAQAMLARE